MSKPKSRMALLGELPELEETQSGKDLIAIGEKRGKMEGKRKGRIDFILLFLQSKHGELPKEFRKAVSLLSAAKANRVITHLPQCETLQDVQSWLDENA